MRWHNVKADLVSAAVVLVLLSLCGCSVYMSRYFERADTNEIRLDQYRLLPRIFAYQEEKTSSPRVSRGTFTVTIRVEDVASSIDEYEWRYGQYATDSLADRFLRQVEEKFVVDSLKLSQSPGSNASIKLLPDRTNYSPRREDFLTFRFGETVIPRETEALRVVLYVTRPGPSPILDSTVFPMRRVEIEDKGLIMFRENVHGY